MRTNDGEQPCSYRILDSEGRPIGRVRAPRGILSLGRGAGTVLLVRERPSPDAQRPRCGSPDRRH